MRDLLPYLASSAPVVETVAHALPLKPTALLIGTAPKGGKLPPEWRSEILAAIAGGLEIVSGLHDMLGDDPKFAAAAKAHNVRIWDVRKPPETPLFSGSVYDVKAPIVLAIGNDCAVGKMTVMLELARAAREAGAAAEFVPTGQTGIMIAGWGIAVDRVISDFATGASEQLVVEAARREPEYILVEGQGAINHPAYAPVTLALLFGCAPDALLLVVDVKRTRMETYDTPALSYAQLIAVHEDLCATVKPANVVGIALNTFGLDDGAAAAEIARARAETSLPADDVVRHGAAHLWSAIVPHLAKRHPLAAKVVA